MGIEGHGSPPAVHPSADDRAEIADALYRFCFGQDLRDRDIFASAFSENATVDFRGPAGRLGVEIPIFEGRDAITDTIFSAIAPLDTTHTATNLRVTEFDGTIASAVALVEAQHLLRDDHQQHLLLKNIYRLKLSRSGTAWVIDAMKIDLVWKTGKPSVLFP